MLNLHSHFFAFGRARDLAVRNGGFCCAANGQPEPGNL